VAVKLAAMIQKHGVEYVLREVCGLEPTEKLYEMILSAP